MQPIEVDSREPQDRPRSADAQAPSTHRSPSELLKPYVPLLVIEWLRSNPAETHIALDASMVFVDISGFTALTERLAKKGKIGAELMRDTLDGVFKALLDDAYDFGAGLLKWGGDALLLLFDGPEHEKRACRAAWEMQRTIDRVGRLKVSGGNITLRMSVGIGTGTFHFFMTGSVHRELVIAGPAMSETLQIEAIADAGEIGLSPAMTAKLDPSCVGPRKETAFLLAAPPDADRDRSRDVGDVSGIDIASCIPVAARAHVLLEKSEPEHRTITAAFIDMMDTDRLLEELGPEGLARGLDERMRAIQESALKYEVPFYETDVGKSSVKALLTAGAPSSTGHDEERMLRALREIMDQPGTIPMRIGVNTGKVFTGDFGPAYRRAYRVFGDAINTAARVMSKAEAGQILATEIVLARSPTTFATVAIEPFAAKGKAEPIRASVVGPIAGAREAHRGRVPLIGRTKELKAVLEAVDSARNGAGWIVEIVGEPGVGKTRLVEEAIARSPDFRVLHTQCEEYESSTPYFPLRAVMRAVLEVDADAPTDVVVERLRQDVRQVDEHLLGWLPLLAVLLGIKVPSTPETTALDERFLRDRLAEVVMEFLAARLVGSPAMLVVENIQHIDEATHDLLFRLSTAGADKRQVLVVTSTDLANVFAQTDDPSLRSIALCLGPLHSDSVVELAQLVLEDDPLRPHDVDEISRRSAGNPLFLFELLDAVRATGNVGSLPDSLESLISGDIDRLSPTDRTVLRYAAVLGTSFDSSLLREVLPDVPAEDPVWHRLADFLVDSEAGMRFRHALVRDAAYEGLPYRRRRELHGAVGDAIERTAVSVEDEAPILSLHFYEAQRFDEAWRYSSLAGRSAKQLYANVEAESLLVRAADSARRVQGIPADELSAAFESLGEVRVRLGDYDRGGAALREARRLTGSDPAETARLMLREGAVQWRRGRHSQALRWIRRGLRTVEGIEGKAAQTQRAQLYAWHGVVRFRQGRALETIDWCRRAIDEAVDVDAREALAHAYYVLDYALVALGRYDEAVYSERALAIYEEIGDLSEQAAVLNNIGMFSYFQGRWDTAIEYYRRAEEVWGRSGDRWLGSFATANRGELLSDQGRLEEAEPVLRSALRVARAAGAPSRIADVASYYGRLAARAGRFDEAHALLEEAQGHYQQDGAHTEVLLTDARLSECLAFEGRAEESLARCDAALARIPSLDGVFLLLPFLLRLRGWGLLAAGHVDEAREVLKSSISGADEKDADYEVALAADVLAGLLRAEGEPDEQLETLRDTIFADLGVVAPPVLPAACALRHAPSGSHLTTPG